MTVVRCEISNDKPGMATQVSMSRLLFSLETNSTSRRESFYSTSVCKSHTYSTSSEPAASVLGVLQPSTVWPRMDSRHRDPHSPSSYPKCCIWVNELGRMTIGLQATENPQH